MYDRREYLEVNVIKGVINSVILLAQSEKSIAFNAKDTLTRSIALGRADAFTQAAKLLQENLSNNING